MNISLRDWDIGIFERFEYFQIGSVLNGVVVVGFHPIAVLGIYGRISKFLDADLSGSMPVTFARAFLTHLIAYLGSEAYSTPTIPSTTKTVNEFVKISPRIFLFGIVTT